MCHCLVGLTSTVSFFLLAVQENGQDNQSDHDGDYGHDAHNDNSSSNRIDQREALGVAYRELLKQPSRHDTCVKKEVFNPQKQNGNTDMKADLGEECCEDEPCGDEDGRKYSKAGNEQTEGLVSWVPDLPLHDSPHPVTRGSRPHLDFPLGIHLPEWKAI